MNKCSCQNWQKFIVKKMQKMGERKKKEKKLFLVFSLSSCQTHFITFHPLLHQTFILLFSYLYFDPFSIFLFRSPSSSFSLFSPSSSHYSKQCILNLFHSISRYLIISLYLSHLHSHMVLFILKRSFRLVF